LSQVTLTEISAFWEKFQQCKYCDMGHTQLFTKYIYLLFMVISFHSTVYNLCIVNQHKFIFCKGHPVVL